MVNKDDVLVLDIECWSDYDIKTQNAQYIQDAKVKWIGLYSYKQDKYYEVLIAGNEENKRKVIEFIKQHKTLVGFNHENFDLPILKNNNMVDDNQFFYTVDVQRVLSDDKKKGGKARGGLMGYDFKYDSLKEYAKTMQIETQKGDINYTIFKKDEYTQEEIIEIKKYLKADIEATKQIFDKCYDFWLPFTEFLSQKNINNWSWIKSTIACLVYKVCCNLLNEEETYGNGIKERGLGARVIEPKLEEEWDLYYGDVVSLYPHIYAMFNLIAEVYDKKGWHGNDIFKVKGYYDITKPHKLSILLMEFLNTRIGLKKKDKKNKMIQALKIFLNTFYGANRNPIFEKIYTENSGEDCCNLGQQINIIMENKLTEKGYRVIAGDTDSNFFKALIPKTEIEVKQDLYDIASYINSNVPFPQPTFQIAIEHHIDYIMYVKDEEKILKKNYAYIYTDDKKERQVVIMGMPIIKSNGTELGKHILNKYIIPRMKLELKGKFESQWIKDLIKEELKINLPLMAQEYRCQPYESYALKSRNNIYARISKEYLSGNGGYMKLIKNKRLGKVGEGDKYCSIEEAELGKLTDKDLDLTKVYNELSPFVRNGLDIKQKISKSANIFEWINV